MTVNRQDILRSYRHIYRQGLHAIQFSTPSRYTLRSELRYAYRHGSAVDFDAKKVENTIKFLSDATKTKGPAHALLKNLLHVWWWQPIVANNPKEYAIPTSFQHFNITLKMLNNNLGMCLPERDVREEKVRKLDDSLFTNKTWQGRPSNI